MVVKDETLYSCLIHTSPHVRLVVLIGSTGENKGLVANILLVLIPKGKIG